MNEFEEMAAQLPENLRACVQKKDDGTVEFEVDRRTVSRPVDFYIAMGLCLVGSVMTGLIFLLVLVGLVTGESDGSPVPVLATGVVSAGFAFGAWHFWRWFHTTEMVEISSDHIRVFTIRGSRRKKRLDCPISGVQEVGFHKRLRNDSHHYMYIVCSSRDRQEQPDRIRVFRSWEPDIPEELTPVVERLVLERQGTTRAEKDREELLTTPEAEIEMNPPQGVMELHPDEGRMTVVAPPPEPPLVLKIVILTLLLLFTTVAVLAKAPVALIPGLLLVGSVGWGVHRRINGRKDAREELILGPDNVEWHVLPRIGEPQRTSISTADISKVSVFGKAGNWRLVIEGAGQDQDEAAQNSSSSQTGTEEPAPPRINFGRALTMEEKRWLREYVKRYVKANAGVDINLSVSPQ